jgi:hypothetical protein
MNNAKLRALTYAQIAEIAVVSLAARCEADPDFSIQDVAAFALADAPVKPGPVATRLRHLLSVLSFDARCELAALMWLGKYNNGDTFADNLARARGQIVPGHLTMVKCPVDYLSEKPLWQDLPAALKLLGRAEARRVRRR